MIVKNNIPWKTSLANLLIPILCHGQNIIIENIGPPINTKWAEYVPVISADESVMLFTYRGVNSIGGLQNQFGEPDPHGQYYEDVFQSFKSKGGSWTTPLRLGENINTNGHEACLALSADGQILFTYKDMQGTSVDIFVCQKSGNAWSKPVRLNNINSENWEGGISISADKQRIYFSSDRPGGFGGRDIYSSTRLPGGIENWSEPINLGSLINTSLDDESPYIHTDGKTLFFSSRGHDSSAGYDIFRSVYYNGEWSKAENLSTPINTINDDRYLVVTADGRHAYYSSNRKGGFGGSDIYRISLPEGFMQPQLTLIRGRITGTDTTQPVEATIQVIDNMREKGEHQAYYGGYKFKREPHKDPGELPVVLLNISGDTIRQATTDKRGEFIFKDLPSSGNFIVKLGVSNPALELFLYKTRNDIIGEYKSNRVSGDYLFTLPSGTNYSIIVMKDGYLFHSENIDLSETSGYHERDLNVSIAELTKDKKIVLKNIFFEKDSGAINPESQKEMELITSLLRSNPGLAIEIAGHTDNTGSKEHNQQLSEKRAKNVIEYLIAQGIDKARMHYIGYGATRPIASNDTREGQKLNRRIELRIVAY